MPGAPDPAFRGRHSDPARGLERRSRLLEELDFLGRGLAAEHGVAVREAAEARDDLVVAPCVADVLRVQRLGQGKRAALRGEIFRVLEGQVGEAALRW